MMSTRSWCTRPSRTAMDRLVVLRMNWDTPCGWGRGRGGCRGGGREGGVKGERTQYAELQSERSIGCPPFCPPAGHAYLVTPPLPPARLHALLPARLPLT